MAGNPYAAAGFPAAAVAWQPALSPDLSRGIDATVDLVVDALTRLRARLALTADADLPLTSELRIVHPAPGRHRSGNAGNAGTAGPPGVPQRPDDPVIVPDGDEAVHELVVLAQGGDAEAFGRLYDRYVDLVHRYIYYRVGSRPLAEDLTSETFLRALRRISSYTWQGVDIGAWFVTIARNLVADHYKSGRYRLEVQVQEVRDDRTLDGPEDEVLDSLDHRVLLEAITKLGAEQQECIVLRFLQGLSVSETAQVMGKNDGAVKALQYRAVRSLSRLLPAGFVR